MDAKFREPEKDIRLNEVDFVNFYYNFMDIFEGVKGANIISETEVAFLDPDNLDISGHNKPTFVLRPDNFVGVLKNNQWNIAIGSNLSKFMLLSSLRFAGDFFSTVSYISYHVRKKEIPFIRVGCDFFKVIEKKIGLAQQIKY